MAENLEEIAQAAKTSINTIDKPLKLQHIGNTSSQDAHMYINAMGAAPILKKGQVSLNPFENELKTPLKPNEVKQIETYQDPTGGAAFVNKAARDMNTMEYLHHALLKGITIVGTGPIDLLGFLTEIPEILNGTSDATNFFTENAEKIRARSEVAYPLPVKNVGATFAFDDPGWIANGAVSAIASSLSLMIPAGIMTKGTKFLASSVLKGIATKEATSMTARAIAKATKGFTTGGRLGLATESAYMAGLMRGTENVMEGYQVNKKTIEENASSFLDPKSETYITDAEFEELKIRNKFDPNTTREEALKLIAAKATTESYRINKYNFIFDFAQTFMLLKGLQGFSRASIASKRAQALEMNSAAKGWGTFGYNTWGYRAGTLGHTVATQGLSEGLEEIVNYIGTEEGLSYGKQLITGKKRPEFKERLNNYLHNPHAWESAFWGAIGGTITPGAISFGNRIVEKGKKKLYGTPTTVDKKVDEISSRKLRLGVFQGIVNQLNEGIDPATGEKLDGTEEEIIEKKKYLKDQYLRGLGQDLARNAVDVGNDKWLKSFFESNEVFDTLNKTTELTKNDFNLISASVNSNISKYTNIKNVLSSSSYLLQLGKYVVNPHLIDVAAQRILESEHSQEVLSGEKDISRRKYEEELEKDVYRNNLTEEERVIYDNHIEYEANKHAIKELEKAKKTNKESLTSVPFIKSLDAKIIELETRNNEIKQEKGNYHWSMGQLSMENLSHSHIYEGLLKAEQNTNKFRFDNNSEVLQSYQQELDDNIKQYNEKQINDTNDILDSITAETENFTDTITALEKDFNERNPTLKGKIKFKEKLEKLVSDKEKLDNSNSTSTIEDAEITPTEEIGGVTSEVLEEVLGAEERIAKLNNIIAFLEQDTSGPTTVSVDGSASDMADTTNTSFSSLLDEGVDLIDSYISEIVNKKTTDAKTLQVLDYLRNLQLRIAPVLDNIQQDTDENSLNIYLRVFQNINNNRVDGNVALTNSTQAIALKLLTEQYKKGDTLQITEATKREDFLTDEDFEIYTKKAKQNNDVVLVIRGERGTVLGYVNQKAYLENELKLLFDIDKLSDNELTTLERNVLSYYLNKNDDTKNNITSSEEYKKLTLSNTDNVDINVEHLVSILLHRRNRKDARIINAKVTRENLRNWEAKIKRDLKNSEDLKALIKQHKSLDVDISHLTSGMVALKRVNGKNETSNLNEIVVGPSADVEIGLTQKGSENKIIIPLNPNIRVSQTANNTYKQTFFMLLESKGKYIPTPLYLSYIEQQSSSNQYLKYIESTVKEMLTNLETNNSLKNADFGAKSRELESVVSLKNGSFNTKPKTGNQPARFEYFVGNPDNKTVKDAAKYVITLVDGKLVTTVTAYEFGKAKNSVAYESQSALHTALGRLHRRVDFKLLKDNKPFYDPVSQKSFNSYKEYAIDSGAFRTSVANVMYGNKFVGNFVASQQNNGEGSSLILNINAKSARPSGAPAARRENNISPSGGIPNVNKVLENTPYSFMEKEYNEAKMILDTEYRIPPITRPNAYASVTDNVLSFYPAFDKLSSLGQQQILSHEIIHGVLSNLRKTNPQQAALLSQRLDTYVTNLNAYIKINNIAVPDLVQQVLDEATNDSEEVLTYAFTMPTFAKFLNSMVINDSAKPDFKESFLTKLKNIIIDVLEKLGYTQLDKLHQILDETIFTGENENLNTESEITNVMNTEDTADTTDNNTPNLTNTDVSDDLFADLIDYPSNIRSYKSSLRQRFRDRLVKDKLIDKYNQFQIGLDNQGKSALSRIYDVAYELEKDARGKGFNVKADEMFSFGEDFTVNTTKGTIIFNDDLYDIRYASIAEEVQNRGKELRKKCL